MIRSINLNDQERQLIINILRTELKESFQGSNKEVIEEHKHKSNYLDELNKNEKLIGLVKKLLKKLE